MVVFQYFYIYPTDFAISNNSDQPTYVSKSLLVIRLHHYFIRLVLSGLQTADSQPLSVVYKGLVILRTKKKKKRQYA